MELDGLASDAEDGPLGDSAPVWTSNRQGLLGTGRHQALTGLLPGSHTLNLTAVDSDGMTAAASVMIYVGYGVRLPLLVQR